MNKSILNWSMTFLNIYNISQHYILFHETVYLLKSFQNKIKEGYTVQWRFRTLASRFVDYYPFLKPACHIKVLGFKQQIKIFWHILGSQCARTFTVDFKINNLYYKFFRFLYCIKLWPFFNLKLAPHSKREVPLVYLLPFSSKFWHFAFWWGEWVPGVSTNRKYSRFAC